jgi:hypothetical protein
MRPRPTALSLWLCVLALGAGSAAAWAQDSCPSLSGCPYQAGRPELPARETTMPAPPPTSEVRPPVMLNSCDAGGCVGPDATRYNGSGAATESGVYLDPQGRRCVRSGDWLQCG